MHSKLLKIVIILNIVAVIAALVVNQMANGLNLPVWGFQLVGYTFSASWPSLLVSLYWVAVWVFLKIVKTAHLTDKNS